MMVFLTGFMGCGKSTVGRLLARRLGYFFLDTDAEIERQQQCTIAEIFAYAGELRFRDLETQMLERLQGSANVIVSTGGGMIVRPENREWMKQLGRRVYLRVPEEVLFARLQRDRKRPLMQHELPPEERVRSLMVDRSPLYEEAELIIDSQDLTPAQTTTAIIRSL